jgi:hypothetical protein
MEDQQRPWSRPCFWKQLGRGFRRNQMGTMIAEPRLLRRQQSERHFPAMILGRSDTAPVRALEVIE